MDKQNIKKLRCFLFSFIFTPLLFGMLTSKAQLFEPKNMSKDVSIAFFNNTFNQRQIVTDGVTSVTQEKLSFKDDIFVSLAITTIYYVATTENQESEDTIIKVECKKTKKDKIILIYLRQAISDFSGEMEHKDGGLKYKTADDLDFICRAFYSSFQFRHEQETYHEQIIHDQENNQTDNPTTDRQKNPNTLL